MRIQLTVLGSAFPKWEFQPVSTPKDALFDVATSHLWQVDRDLYPGGGEGGEEIISPLVSYIFANGESVVWLNGACTYSVPFPTWDVEAPKILAVQPDSVRRGGGSFLILGEQMYPNIVSNVLLGGDPLNAANVTTIDDTEIRVVVPSGQQVGSTPSAEVR